MIEVCCAIRWSLSAQLFAPAMALTTLKSSRYPHTAFSGETLHLAKAK